MDHHRLIASISVALFVAAALYLALAHTPAVAHDIPNEIILHSFVKPEGQQLHFVVRVPLVMLTNMNLPKRGPGYLDLGRIDNALQASAQVTAKELDLFENGIRLTPARMQARIAQPSNRSFETYAEALADIEGPRLAESTNVFWNQGYFDVHLEYPIRSEQSDFSLDMGMAPGLSGRLKMRVRFMPPEGSTRVYEIHGGFGRLALDPRWHQAAWVFVKSGLFHILDGTDHLLFLFCLIIPFRRRGWDLLKLITAFTIAHSVTLIASAYGIVPTGDWFPPVVEMLIALSIVYMALENIVNANLQRRWFITCVFGLIHGFGFSFALKQDLQFAGEHHLLSLLSFNIGVECGQIVLLLFVIPLLNFLFRYIPERLGIVVLSVVVAHTGWHWIVERAKALQQVEWPRPDAFSMPVPELLLLLLGIGIAWFVARQLRRRVAAQKLRGERNLA